VFDFLAGGSVSFFVFFAVSFSFSFSFSFSLFFSLCFIFIFVGRGSLMLSSIVSVSDSASEVTRFRFVLDCRFTDTADDLELELSVATGVLVVDTCSSLSLLLLLLSFFFEFWSSRSLSELSDTVEFEMSPKESSELSLLSPSLLGAVPVVSGAVSGNVVDLLAGTRGNRGCTLCFSLEGARGGARRIRFERPGSVAAARDLGANLSFLTADTRSVGPSSCPLYTVFLLFKALWARILETLPTARAN
jgi:hypothetical protein